MVNHEWMFYEVMWRAWGRGAAYPLPWWAVQSLRAWSDDFDGGLFVSKEAAFSANALYRYWNMIGVKDAGLESLVGQAGEIAPVLRSLCGSGFLSSPTVVRSMCRNVRLPNSALSQRMDDGYLPVVVTTYRVGNAVLEQKALATTVGLRQRSVVLQRLRVRAEGGTARGWLCLSLLPWGPSSFQRHDRAGRYQTDRQLTFVRYLPAESRVEVNSGWGPVFDTPPVHFGVYGNPFSSTDPEGYLRDNPWNALDWPALLTVPTPPSTASRECAPNFGLALARRQASASTSGFPSTTIVAATTWPNYARPRPMTWRRQTAPSGPTNSTPRACSSPCPRTLGTSPTSTGFAEPRC